MAQEVNKTSINAFSRGLDSDTKDAVLPQDAYRYAENVRNEDGAVTRIRGSETSIPIETFSSGMELYVLGREQARLFIQDESKTTDCVVLFYFMVVGGTGTFKVQVIPLDNDLYDPYTAFTENIPSDQFDAYKRTTVDIEKIGQAGYDIIYFVDNIRQPRKLELFLKSFILDYVDISLVSVIERVGQPGVFDVVVRLNIKDSFSEGATVNSQKAFTAYIRSYRPSLGTSHPSFNSGTNRLKAVSFSIGESTKTASFAIFEDDLDTWSFNLFYNKIGDDVFSDFLIAEQETVTVAVGVLPEDNLVKARSAQNGDGAASQILSWDFLISGPVFNYYTDTEIITVGVTKIYKSNREEISNYVANGYHQDWRSASQNNYILVASGVITGYGINNGDVVVTAQPAGYQAAVDVDYTTTNFPRLSTVNIGLPQNISGDDFKRAEVGTSLVLNNNPFSYNLVTKDQLGVKAIYRDEVVLRVDVLLSTDNPSYLTVDSLRRFSVSMEVPTDVSLTLNFTHEASASTSEATSFAQGVSSRVDGITVVARVDVGSISTINNSTPASVIVPAGNDAIFEVQAASQKQNPSDTVSARGEVIFTGISVEGALVIDKFLVNNVLYNYTLVDFNAKLNELEINRLLA